MSKTFSSQARPGDLKATEALIFLQAFAVRVEYYVVERYLGDKWNLDNLRTYSVPPTKKCRLRTSESLK